MDKDTILKLSRQENEDGQDEREQSIEAKAAKVGKAVGIAVCLLLVLVADWILGNGDLARGAWVVFFAMEGSGNLYKYKSTGKTSALVWGVLQLLCSIIYVVLIFLIAGIGHG